MELIIRRNQDKGFLSGIKFVLEAKVILTEEESALIKKYKAYKEILFSKGGRTYTINDLMHGMKDKVKDVSILQKNEDVYIEACQYLKTLLNIMKSFGGEYRLSIKDNGVFTSSGEKIKS